MLSEISQAQKAQDYILYHARAYLPRFEYVCVMKVDDEKESS